MTTSISLRILRIRALLRINGSLKSVETVICSCQLCGRECRLSAGRGLEEVATGVQLTCPTCHNSADVPTAQFSAQWEEQLRRDRILIRAGINPDDLYGP